MFHYMLDVLAWGVAISFLAFVVAFASEGRGQHLVRVILGLAPRKQGLDNFTSVPRDEGDWRLVEVLDDTVRPARAAQPSGEIRREAFLTRS